MSSRVYRENHRSHGWHGKRIHHGVTKGAQNRRHSRILSVPSVTLWCFLLSVCCACCSCAGKARPLYPVHGRVFFEDQPMARALIVFHPLDDPDAIKPRAHSEADGSFVTYTYAADDGAPAGDYAVTIVWKAKKKDKSAPRPTSKQMKKAEKTAKLAGKYDADFPARYQDPNTSGLRVHVREGTNELEPFYLGK